jgi:hypothetical protein
VHAVQTCAHLGVACGRRFAMLSIALRMDAYNALLSVP